MADEESKEEGQEQQDGGEKSQGAPDKSSLGLKTWIILSAVVLAGLTGGFALAQLMAGPDPLEPSSTELAAIDEKAMQKNIDELISSGGKKSWLYTLDPVLANLNEVGVTRYVRATVVLVLSEKMDPINGQNFLDEKNLILINWMTTYLMGQNLEKVRGSRNASRIRREMRDQFNELLFPESTPLVIDVLLKEFVVQ